MVISSIWKRLPLVVSLGLTTRGKVPKSLIESRTPPPAVFEVRELQPTRASTSPPTDNSLITVFIVFSSSASQTDDPWGNEDQQFFVGVVAAVVLEQRAQDRHVGEPRHAVLALVARHLVDAADHRRSAVAHDHLRLGFLGVDRSVLGTHHRE